MSHRPRRTRVYDANYNIGESYYKSALDRLDRKYSGRSEEPASANPSLPEGLQDRYNRVFEDDDLNSARRRAEKHITEDTVFDSRSALRSANSAVADRYDEEVDEELAGTLKRIRAAKKMNRMMEDLDLKSTVNNISSKRSLGLTDKLLDSVGLSESNVRRVQSQNTESSMISKRRSTSHDEDTDNMAVAKWSALKDRGEDSTTSAAAHRAKQSRARLHDLEEEMEMLSERQAAREKRLAHVRAFVAENDEAASNVQTSSVRSARISARSEKKTVTF